ncbi:P-loop containing nucleoside triphosphate hydrolase protein [Serendipita vermifera]|nr:P-loop containing nucleoside triphosphate hydrolase protein [Serendipita vermifera]
MATRSMPGIYRRICKSHVLSSPGYSMRSYISSKWCHHATSIPRTRQAKPAKYMQTRSNVTFSDIRETLPLSKSQVNTIYALSTPPGRAGVAVIRISGPETLRVYHSMIQNRSRTRKRDNEHSGAAKMTEKHPEPWKMFRCSIVHPQTRQVLDEAMAVYFASPHSFTSEDVLELHIHSGPAIIAAVYDALSTIPGCRIAERGEFTRRAFEAGKLDLTQVEGLQDLIDAETEEQRKWALGATQGTVRDEIEKLRDEIIACLMLCEAEIDFGDTEDIDKDNIEQARNRVISLLDRIQGHLKDSRRGEIMRSGIKVAIFGEPNAGKSSLLNWLARRQAAIVTPVPGTTRDVLEVSLDVEGLPLIVCDTAGLRETQDVVESIGVERAIKTVRDADIALCVVSIPDMERRHSSQSGGESSAAQWAPEIQELLTEQTMVLFNKVDLATQLAPQEQHLVRSLEGAWGAEIEANSTGSPTYWAASVTTGEGMQEFIRGFSQAIKERYVLLSTLGLR